MQTNGAPTRQSAMEQCGLEMHGLHHLGAISWNLGVPSLCEQAIRRGEVRLADNGPLVVYTGQHTGRAPKDKYVVCDEITADQVWWSDTNRRMTPTQFRHLHRRLSAYLQGRTLFVQDCLAGTTATYGLPIRVITETAWHSLFTHHLFRRLPNPNAAGAPQFTVIHAPNFRVDPALDETRSDVCIAIDFSQRLILICGTHYAGEIKKAIFTVLNYLLPQQGMLPMHCSANVNTNGEGDTALFFGLSGTGKTTLSTDPTRLLIGDDEHGWSDSSIFNFEGGCYAKTIRISPHAEPAIYAATQRFGTILENVRFDEATAQLDFDDETLTENTRAAYPLHYIDNRQSDGMGTHPKHIFMLSADAFGVLPPIARLDTEQAMAHFLNGYTARVAGTEHGIAEPQAVFSPCFGAPFLPLPPRVYAQMLGEKLQRHQATVWLINTGWSGGPYGVGQRMALPYTRALIQAVLTGAIADVPFAKDPYFGLCVPQLCPGVPHEVLNPRQTWADPVAYDQQAQRLANMFTENQQQFAPATPVL